MESDRLVPRLQAISDANPMVRIFVCGDEAVAYGGVGVMGGSRPPGSSAWHLSRSFRTAGAQP